jgi:outer membrane protein OmpA-like peptidoglycan-associated protein
MITKNIVFLLFIFIASEFSAQFFGRKTPSIVECQASVNITESGTYILQFTGSQGYDFKSFIKYSTDSISKNLIWSYFEPEENGTIDFLMKQSSVSLFCFETLKDNPCSDIYGGNAKLLFYKNASDTSKSWNIKVDEKKLYFFIFSYKQKSTETLSFDFFYIQRDKDGSEIKDEKVVNLRDKNKPNYTYIKIRNARTKKPVVVNLAIFGTKEIEGYYQASDLYLTVNKSNKSMITTDVRGYFSRDIQYKFLIDQIDTILIEIEPLTIGATAQFEDIQFYRGTSNIMKSSEKKIKRLVDFMALNANVSIEIQGHVNDKSKKNKKSSVRLSRQRAKRVLRYLVHNGIHPSRMTAVGYGNSKPIYPQPKQAFEEQANRRVEIMIK